MDRREELQLAEEVLRLKKAKSSFTKGGVLTRSYAIYRDEGRFQQEREFFLRTPHAIAHSSELDGPDTFLRTSYAGVPLLLTRDAQGTAHAFLNACRHRGMQLVSDERGCSKRFTCPYHAWSYGSDGHMLAAPHFEQGFVELDRGDLGLRRVACIEYLGFLWITLAEPAAASSESFLAPIADDMRGLDFASMAIAQESRLTVKANWKLLIEGGLEAYHFKIAHRQTIGPFFENNLSTYQQLGDHIRSVLPRVSLNRAAIGRKSFRIRDWANIAYWLAPNTQFLAQQDHIVWTQSNPRSAAETDLRLVTLVPAEAGRQGGTPEHWEKNHRITLETLVEDFEIGERIQEYVSSGLDQAMLFGRFESALDAFNGIVERHLGKA